MQYLDTGLVNLAALYFIMDLDITDDAESNGNSCTYFLFLMSMKLMAVESCVTFSPLAELQKEASKPQEHLFYKMSANNFF